MKVFDILNEMLNLFFMILLVILFGYGVYGIGDSYILEEEALPKHYEIYCPTQDPLSFQELQNINEDVCAWITIYGTHVDYPVVQGVDNSTYLMHNVQGEYKLSGSIFVDCNDQNDFSDFNTILYGHHMEGGAMFGDLEQYSDSEFADSHLYGTIFVDGKTYGLEMFAFIETSAYQCGLYRAPIQNMQVRQNYLDEIRETAMWYRDTSVTEKDRLVVMSTCTERITNGRHILVGKITEQIYENPYEVPEEEKVVEQIDSIDWTIFWRTSARKIGALLLMLVAVLLMLATGHVRYRKEK